MRDWRDLRQAEHAVHDLDHRVGKDSDDQRCQRRDGQGDSHGRTKGEGFFFERLAHKHRVSDAQVVVEAENGIENGECGERVVSGLDQAEKDEVLPPEPGERRDTC